MQTPLPEKIKTPEIKLDLILNQIITYLAELSEVVEGKPTYADGYKQGKFDAEMDKLNKVPPLKETELYRLSVKEMLLEAMPDKKPFKHYSGDSGDAEWNRGYDRGYNAAVTDVEAIINRLIS